MDSKKIGAFIAFNRKKKGMTQEQLGERLGVTNKTISRWENGNYMPDLSEHGYVFEIDSENCGVTIDYHTTDWYGNEDLYTEKGLIYNSVSAFALIRNLEYIRYNFSGSSYMITREKVEQNYPEYRQVVTGQEIDKEAFDRYVESKMNEDEFVTAVFGLFEKQE